VLLGAKKLLAKLLEKLTGVSAGAEGGDYQSPKRREAEGVCERALFALPSVFSV
jgi:hypothetical protein